MVKNYCMHTWMHVRDNNLDFGNPNCPQPLGCHQLSKCFCRCSLCPFRLGSPPPPLPLDCPPKFGPRLRNTFHIFFPLSLPFPSSSSSPKLWPWHKPSIPFCPYSFARLPSSMVVYIGVVAV